MMKIEILEERSLINFDDLPKGQFFWKNGFDIDEVGLKIDYDAFILCTGTLNIYKEVNDVEHVIPMAVRSFKFYTDFSYNESKTTCAILEIPNYDFFIYNSKIYVKNEKSSDLNAICIAKIVDWRIEYFYEDADTVSQTFYEHLPEFELAQIIDPVIKLEPQRKK